MTTYDVLDEATIAATPAEIVRALLDEAAGRSHWWEPFLRMRQRGDKPPTEIGAVVDLIINSDGRLGQRWGTVRFSGRVTAYEQERRLVLDYFDGDFRGTGEWTLTPVDAGHTRIAMRWMTDPHGGMRLWARLVDVPSSHSKVMQEGFSAIERYAAGRTAESRA
ncbi:MAG: SRPBCC family protein [Micromonosporaceae bacterium]